MELYIQFSHPPHDDPFNGVLSIMMLFEICQYLLSSLIIFGWTVVKAGLTIVAMGMIFTRYRPFIHLYITS